MSLRRTVTIFQQGPKPVFASQPCVQVYKKSVIYEFLEKCILIVLLFASH